MKQFILISIILIGGLAGLMAFQNGSAHLTLSLWGINVTLPVYLWIAGGMGIIFLVGFLFLLWNSARTSYYRRRVEGEIKKLLKIAEERIFYRRSELPKLKVLDKIGELIANIWGNKLTFEYKTNFPYMEVLKRIEEGEVVDLSPYKVPFDNPWEIKNGYNILKKEPARAKEVLDRYPDPKLKEAAFRIYAKTAPIREILKYDFPIDWEIVEPHLHDPELPYLLPRAQLTPQQQVEVARAIYTTRTPEEELEILKNQPVGQIYLALKYEHIEKGKELSELHKIELFHYFIKLRELGEKVEVDEFLESIWG